MTPRRCNADVYDGAEVSPRKCRLAPVVMRGGRWYCRRHDPGESVEAGTRYAAM